MTPLIRRETRRRTPTRRTTPFMSALMLGALALSALGSLTLGTAAQAQQYKITLDTSSLAGTAGNLDFAFDPGGPDSQNALLQVTGFTTTGTLAGTAQDTGGGAGTLPGTLTLANIGSNNDVFQGITFGSTLSFFTTFSGPAITAPTGKGAGSTFAFSLYDASGTKTLLGVNPDGSVLDIMINPGGSQTLVSSSTALTVTMPGVPEASPALSLGLLLALGGGAVALRRLRAADALECVFQIASVRGGFSRKTRRLYKPRSAFGGIESPRKLAGARCDRHRNPFWWASILSRARFTRKILRILSHLENTL